MEQGEYDPEIVSASGHHPTGVSQNRETHTHQGNVEMSPRERETGALRFIAPRECVDDQR